MSNGFTGEQINTLLCIQLRGLAAYRFRLRW